MTVRSSLTTSVRANASSRLGGPIRGIDVEVVEHLEVVGREAMGDDEDAGVTVSGHLVDHLRDVGSAPRLGGPAGRLPSDPPRRIVQSGAAGDGGRGGGQVVGVGVVRERPLGQ